MVQFHWAPRKFSSEPGTHSNLVSMPLSVGRLQDVSVFRVRLLFPFPDRFTTAIILPFVVDNAVVCETTGKRVDVLRLFGGQVFSDWFGHIKSHAVLLRAIAQPEVSQHTGEMGSTHEKVC